MRAFAVVAALAIAIVASCQSRDSGGAASHGSGSAARGSGSGSAAAVAAAKKVEQVEPPPDLKTPPADAIALTGGMLFKKRMTNPNGTGIQRNDTVLVNSTSWRQSNGETLATNKHRGQPFPHALPNETAAFAEVISKLKKGETAVVWVPPSVRFRSAAPPVNDTIVYEIEVVDVIAAPPVPADVGAPPATAKTGAAGEKYEIVQAGSGSDRARAWDTVTFTHSAWDATGRMFDSTETRRRPGSSQPFRQSTVMQDVLTSMAPGERRRFWVDAAKMAEGSRATATLPTGLLCYEVSLVQIAKAPADPPPAPADVGKPPATAKQTARGVWYQLLAAGPGSAAGDHPKSTDSVRVAYTGWTTDGRLFDSTALHTASPEVSLIGSIAGFADGIEQMAVGDKMRLWIPDQLAYKGVLGHPQGMLVFDVELQSIVAGKPLVSPPSVLPVPPPRGGRVP